LRDRMPSQPRRPVRQTNSSARLAKSERLRRLVKIPVALDHRPQVSARDGQLCEQLAGELVCRGRYDVEAVELPGP